MDKEWKNKIENQKILMTRSFRIEFLLEFVIILFENIYYLHKNHVVW